MSGDVIYVGHTPDRVARNAIAGSGAQHKASRAAAQYIFLKNWIPDLRGGFAAACPGHEAAGVIFAETSSMGEDVMYALVGADPRHPELVGGGIDVTYAREVMYAPRHVS